MPRSQHQNILVKGGVTENLQVTDQVPGCGHIDNVAMICLKAVNVMFISFATEKHRPRGSFHLDRNLSLGDLNLVPYIIMYNVWW